MSHMPNEFGSRVATGRRDCSAFSLYHAYCERSPGAQHHSPAVPAPQANSHSASVGSRQPTHLANTIASNHVTFTTGLVRISVGAARRGGSSSANISLVVAIPHIRNRESS